MSAVEPTAAVRVRRSKVQVGHAQRHMYGVLARAVQPKPVLRVSDWADEKRILSSKGSAMHGQWRTERTPYLREPMDVLSVTSPVQRVVLQFCSQIGKSEVGLNWLGYVMDHAPGPMLAVVPTLEVRKRWKAQRLDPMLGETPALRELLGARKSRDAANSEDLIDFPGGILVLGGANSAASLASMPIRYVLCDEVDRFPWDVGDEGDPLGLIDERTKTFGRRKVLLVSTPTVAGTSRIQMEYEASDQRVYEVPCPHCGEYQVLRWKHQDGRYGLTHLSATGRVVYTCSECGAHIEEHHKPQMLERGRWVARYPERAVRGYTLNGLYSPLGMGFTWAELWQDWLNVQGDSSQLKRFVNTTLAEVWREQGDSLEDVSLLSRKEVYPPELPALARTGFVDVQNDRLELTVVDWGAGEESWVRDHVILSGDTSQGDVWEELEDEVAALGLDVLGVDSGYNATQVYAFVGNKRWARATKGMDGMQRPIAEDERTRAAKLRKRRTKGRAVVDLIGVDNAKALIYARLKQDKPGPGTVHFPDLPAFDDEYFAQVAAEKLVTKYRGMRPVQVWTQLRARNEALDCLVGNLAVLRMAVDLKQLEVLAAQGQWVLRERLARLAVPVDEVVEVVPVVQAVAAAPARRVVAAVQDGGWSFDRRD